MYTFCARRAFHRVYREQIRSLKRKKKFYLRHECLYTIVTRQGAGYNAALSVTFLGEKFALWLPHGKDINEPTRKVSWI